MNGQHNKKEGILFRHLLFLILWSQKLKPQQQLLLQKRMICFLFLYGK